MHCSEFCWHVMHVNKTYQTAHFSFFFFGGTLIANSKSQRRYGVPSLTRTRFCRSRRHAECANESTSFVEIVSKTKLSIKSSLLLHDCIREILCTHRVRTEWLHGHVTYNVRSSWCIFVFYFIIIFCIFFFAEIWIYLRCHSALSDLVDLDLSQRSEWLSERVNARNYDLACTRTAAHFSIWSVRWGDAFAFSICTKEMQFTDSIFFSVAVP